MRKSGKVKKKKNKEVIDGSSDEQELIKNVRDFGPIYKVAIKNLLSGSCLNTAREPSPSTCGIDRVGDPLTL